MNLIFLIIAIVCFILASIGVALGDFQIGWVGLAFFAASGFPSRKV
jgi:hypothetical protein